MSDQDVNKLPEKTYMLKLIRAFTYTRLNKVKHNGQGMMIKEKLRLKYLADINQNDIR